MRRIFFHLVWRDINSFFLGIDRYNLENSSFFVFQMIKLRSILGNVPLLSIFYFNMHRLDIWQRGVSMDGCTNDNELVSSHSNLWGAKGKMRRISDIQNSNIYLLMLNKVAKSFFYYSKLWEEWKKRFHLNFLNFFVKKFQWVTIFWLWWYSHFFGHLIANKSFTKFMLTLYLSVKLAS